MATSSQFLKKVLPETLIGEIRHSSPLESHTRSNIESLNCGDRASYIPEIAGRLSSAIRSVMAEKDLRISKRSSNNSEQGKITSARMQRFDSRLQRDPTRGRSIHRNAPSPVFEQRASEDRSSARISQMTTTMAREREKVRVPVSIRSPGGGQIGVNHPGRIHKSPFVLEPKIVEGEKENVSSIFTDEKSKEIRESNLPHGQGISFSSAPKALANDDPDGFLVDESDIDQLFEKYGGRMYRLFPVFTLSRYAGEYRLFQRTFFCYGSTLVVLIVISVVVLNEDYYRMLGDPDVSESGRGVFHASLALFGLWLLASIIYILIMGRTSAKTSVGEVESPAGGTGTGAGAALKRQLSLAEGMKGVRDGVEHTWLGQHIENTISLILCASMCLRLLAFVLNKSACIVHELDMDISSICKELTSINKLPTELLLIVYLSPIAAQMVFKGTGFRFVLLCWAFSTGFVVAGFMALDGIWRSDHIAVIILATLMLYISMEYERFMRLSFVHSKVHQAMERARLLAVDEKNLHIMEANRRWMENKHHLEKIKLERKSMEAESQQLRNLIGNVAHDLKTPLQSIAMGLEVIKVSLENIVIGQPLPLTTTLSPAAPAAAEDTLSMLDSLVVTCSFMSMAINRAVDFTKASNGIDLVPSQGTFDLNDAVDMPIACVNNMQSSQSIIVEPLPTDVYPLVISDQHWFRENILCLLSNAVKYSEGGGTINIVLDHLDRGQCIQAIEDASPFGSLSARAKIVPGPMIRVTVEDTGIGIPPDIRKTLFKPFKQAQRMTGGTGLGLFSLSKRVEALGGIYGITDRRDRKQGSAIWFAFPYRPDNSIKSQSSYYSIFPSPSYRNKAPSLKATTSLSSSKQLQSYSSLDVSLQRSTSGNGSGKPSLFLPITRDDDKPVDTVQDTSSVESSTPSVKSRTVTIVEPHRQPCGIDSPYPHAPLLGADGRPHSNSGSRNSNSKFRHSNKDLTPVIEGKPFGASSNAPRRSEEDEDTDTSSAPPSPVPASPAVQPKSLHVLLVDDALSILKVTSKTLQMKGHSVETAQNGSIALKRLIQSLESNQGHDFDVVLMDLQMPVMDGFEAVRRYREFEAAYFKTHAPAMSTVATYGTSAHSTTVEGDSSCALAVEGLTRETWSGIGNSSRDDDKHECKGDDADDHRHRQLSSPTPTAPMKRLLIIGASANSDSVSRKMALEAGMDFFVSKPYTYNDLLPIFWNEGLVN